MQMTQILFQTFELRLPVGYQVKSIPRAEERGLGRERNLGGSAEERRKWSRPVDPLRREAVAEGKRRELGSQARMVLDGRSRRRFQGEDGQWEESPKKDEEGEHEGCLFSPVSITYMMLPDQSS